MTAPPLHPLVVAMARMMCADCRECRGHGYLSDQYGEDPSKPCPTCSDVRRALADAEKI